MKWIELTNDDQNVLLIGDKYFFGDLNGCNFEGWNCEAMVGHVTLGFRRMYPGIRFFRKAEEYVPQKKTFKLRSKSLPLP